MAWVKDFNATFGSFQKDAPSAKKASIAIPDIAEGADDASKQDALMEFIDSLHSANAVPDEGESKRLLEFFRKIYDGVFRADYSAISEMMFHRCLKKQAKGGMVWDSSFLSKNLSQIVDVMQDNGAEKDVLVGVKKLRDHARLEDLRMTFFADQFSELSNSLARELSRAERESFQLDAKIEASNKKLADQQKDYIAILGIFSAVVLAFNGGFSLFGSVMSSVGEANPYALSFFSAFITEAIFGIFYILFSFVCRIVNGGVFPYRRWALRPCGWKTLVGVNGVCLGVMVASLTLWKVQHNELLWYILLACFVVVAVLGFVMLWRYPNGETSISSFVYGGGSSILVDGKRYVVKARPDLLYNESPLEVKLVRFPRRAIKVNGKRVALKREEKYYFDDSQTPKKVFERAKNKGKGPTQYG